MLSGLEECGKLKTDDETGECGKLKIDDETGEAFYECMELFDSGNTSVETSTCAVTMAEKVGAPECEDSGEGHRSELARFRLALARVLADACVSFRVASDERQAKILGLAGALSMCRTAEMCFGPP